MKTHLVLIAALAACDDVPMPYELDHTRVVAVRVDPPSLVAGATATIDVLVTDAEGGARVAPPDAVTVTSPAPLALTQGTAGWTVTAPANLPDGELIVPLDLVIRATDGSELVAQKTLALGATGANPPHPVMLLDGTAEITVMRSDGDIALSVDAMDPALSYRWFSSIGDLTGYTRAEATLEPIAGARGQLGVVVRDQLGGTAWTFVNAEVAE